MAARAPYPPIRRAFERITVDGEALTAAALLERLAARAQEPEGKWAADLRDALAGLIAHGSLRTATSGTTGPPKPMAIGRADLVRSARLTAAAFGLEPGHRALLCLPGRYIAGQMMLVRAFALGLDLHLADPRGSVLERLPADLRFRFAAMVPVQLHRALREDRARVERQFHTILLGGGPVSQELLEGIRGLATAVHLGYGSTETATHVALRRLNGPAPEDHFTAIGHCSFARDPRGCLVARTPHLRVKQHLTNDAVELIDDTRFRWLGRFDHVILSGGKKIHPEQLEARTASLIPYPHYFAGTPDPALGQAVMLVLEADAPQEQVVPQVMERLMAALHPHEWPRRVQVLPRIARTASGKIIRR